MSTTTTNLGLTKPATGDRGWGVTMNANLDALDGWLGRLRAAGAIHDGDAAAGDVYLGLDHLDGDNLPKLCRKGAGGSVVVLG